MERLYLGERRAKDFLSSQTPVPEQFTDIYEFIVLAQRCFCRLVPDCIP